MNKPLVQKLLVIGLLVAGFVLRWLALQQSEFANGWDTYYYLIQLASFQNTGEMHSPEWNLFYPFLIVADWFFTDSVTAVKFLSASLTVLLMYAFYLLAIKLKIRFEYILLLLALLLFSPELTYFASQWPKNLLGIIVYVLLLTALVKRSWYFVIALLIVSFFAHRMTAVLGLITVALWIFNKNINLRLKMGIVTLGLLSLGIFHFVPGLISFYDFERFNSFLGTQLQLPHLSFFHLFETEKISIWWGMELILSILFFSFVIGKLIRQLIKKQSIPPFQFVIIIVLIILWFPFYQMTSDNIPYRLFHAGLLLLPLLLLVSLKNLNLNSWLVKSLTFIIIIFSFFSWKTYTPEKHDPDYKTYSKMIGKLESYWMKNSKPELIIGHKSMAEIITYHTQVDVLPWQVEYEVEDDKLYRIAYLPFDRLYEYYLQEKPYQLAVNYYYMKESDWQLFLMNLRKHENAALYALHQNWKNPHEIRPVYLLKN